MDPFDAARVQETRKRVRIMDGVWDHDLEQRMISHFGLVRREVMGPLTESKNLAKKLCDELSVLYVKPPKVRHGLDGEVSALLGQDGLIGQAGLWSLMPKCQRYTLALREMLVRVDWSAENDALVYRLVTPDLVTAESHPDAPGVPVVIRELRWRAQIKGWAYDVFDISDRQNPTFKIKTKDGNDITEQILGASYSGESYPWRRTEGELAGDPVLPYVLYHAEVASRLWNCFDWSEVFEATLDIACCYSFLLHGIKNASWPQRYAVGAHVAGATTDGENSNYRSVPADPSSLLQLEASQDGIQPQIGAFGEGIDVAKLQQAIAAIEQAMMNVAGVDAANIVRNSSDAWSGAALSINRDGKREAQSVYTPQFRVADLHLIELSAIVSNVFGGFNFPESGYRIDYVSIPLSANELAARRQHHDALIASGRMSPVEAYIEEHPGTTIEEAILALDKIKVDTALATRSLDGTSAQDTALNGAQIASLVQIVQQVAARLLPRDAAVAIVQRAFSVDSQQAENLLGSAGGTFTIDTTEVK